jgi:hypothetical protein
MHENPILITGASSGIGEAYARHLGARGFPLLLVARREERLQGLCQELGDAHRITAQSIVADLASDEGVSQVLEEIRRGPALEMLINNAAFGTRGHFAEVARDKIEAQARLHVLAPVRLTRAVLPQMLRRGRGAVINVSSMSALFPAPHYAGYASSKMYLNTLTEVLHAELAGTGIHVQALCPGLTRTEFLESEEFAGFSFGKVPDSAWMSAEAVVRESMAALGNGTPVFIPGRQNRLFVRVMQTPLLGRAVGWAVVKAGFEY